MYVNAGQRHRALDIGCAVGRATFEFTKTFDEVGKKSIILGVLGSKCDLN
jgi:hypothetical protein